MRTQGPMTPDQLVQLARVRNLCASGLNRSVRLAAGLTIQEVAKACGVSASTICRWEAGAAPSGRKPYGVSALRYGDLLQKLAAGRSNVRRSQSAKSVR